MPNAFQYVIFLSHSAKEMAAVRAVADRLRAHGLKVGFDEWGIPVAAPRQSAARSCDGPTGEPQDRLALPSRRCAKKIEEGPEHPQFTIQPLAFSLQPWLTAPIKGSLAQFLYINWRPADREQEYAKLLAACRGEIDLSSTNEPSLQEQPQVNPSASAKLVHIVHSGSGDIVMGNKTVGRQTKSFTPGPQHITPETARKLSDLVREIVERLTVSGGNVQKAFQRVWGDFNRHFGLTTYKELPREKADEGISYLRQWRASKNSRLRFADPEKFRTAQLKGIWPRSKALGFGDADLYAFAGKKLRLKFSIGSLNDLGNQQLARLNRFLIYEERKLKKNKAASASTSAKE